jgi:hypothetical protein
MRYADIKSVEPSDRSLKKQKKKSEERPSSDRNKEKALEKVRR